LRRRWIAVIDVDQAHFQRTAPPELTFPASRAPSTVELDSDEVLIGRRSESRGIRPDIDLSDLLDDPAVSHRHARLTRTDDGSYALTDLGSTNGTALNDDARLLEANVPVALSDADRILLGAWTVITFRPGPHRSAL
jgi:pSer/pThr/pTyr-binding forkhead associated (FHA) protein